MSYIEFENVKKEYRAGDISVVALEHCSFTIEKGELVVVLGPSGAGKTTVLTCLEEWIELPKEKFLLMVLE